MSFWYDHALQLLNTAALNPGTSDLRAILVMTNTTADTERDKATVGGFTTLDEFDGSGYSRPTLSMSASAENNSTHLSWTDAADFTFGTTVGPGTRQAQGYVIVKNVNGGANDIPIAFVDSGGFPFAGGGGAVNVTVDVAGLLQVAAG